MAKLKAESPFDKKDNNNTDDQSEETAVATATEDTALATPTPSIALDITQADLRLPSLKIVAKVGPLSEQFRPGEVVVDGDAVISDGKEPVEFTVLNARKKYIEYTVYGSEQMPRILWSNGDVKAAGGTTEWTDGPDGRQRPSYDPALVMTVVVKNPQKEPSAHFPFEHGDDYYAVLTYELTRTAYRRAAHKVLTGYSLHLKQDFLRGGFELTTDTATIGGNKVIVPELRYGPLNSEEFVKWARDLIPA
jgi:hypothetical protein